ncbi:UPF0193 protein EVG1 [Thalassophryne amazonica]|uniref:UPF0193 protein EVG1 n=1 Tax=Thalassophryne amazonica TaxID=390379 RepID=UPI00147093DA|nr:UPF0193 protein EVG1 [Thalassophryne amazonica]XP_034043943.1 UPF0193 protein EVG1 [Thalassophryne amazonica]
MTSRGNHTSGLWNCPPGTEYSKETHDMLRLMMQESKVSLLHRRRINDCLKKGEPLPCGPTVSAHPPQARPKNPAPRHLPSRPQRRSAESCRSGNSYCREQFQPRPTRDLEEEKRRLQQIFAGEGLASASPNAPDDKTPEVAEEKDRYQEVLGEIEDRRQFLADMAALGQEKKYTNLINTEILQKIRELEELQKAGDAKKDPRGMTTL